MPNDVTFATASRRDGPLDAPGADEGAAGDSGPSTSSVPRRTRWPIAVAAGLYLAISLTIWWRVWSTHPTTVVTCACGDTSLFTWFLEWPAYALRHGLNPLYSTYLFYPSGVNLLSNTAEIGLGIVLAPVTWIWGPLATLNVAQLLAGPCSAMAMFVLVRRWVRWTPAAFGAGLLYGYSPLLLTSLTDSHFMIGFAPIPPLIVLVLDELLIRQRRRPIPMGLALGLLLLIQFSLGTELLVIAAVMTVLGMVALLVYGAWRRALAPTRLRHAMVGLASGVVSSVVLLAYPAWFALAGPAHLAGPIWGKNKIISYGGPNLHDYLWPAPSSLNLTNITHEWGGYQGVTFSSQYFGWGLCLILVVGLVLWRRDVRLWLFAGLAAIAICLSFGLSQNNWSPFRLLVDLPQMDSLIPSRFLAATYFCAAVMLGLIVDHLVTSVAGRRLDAEMRYGADAPALEVSRSRSAQGALSGLFALTVALGPIIAYEAPTVPHVVGPAVVPEWFSSTAPHLTGHQVALVFPAPIALLQSAMSWQVSAGMTFEQVGGGGPGAIPSRAGIERPGQVVIADVSTPGGITSLTPANIQAVRRALDEWGVTTVVVVDPVGLPAYAQLRNPRVVLMMMTAAIGRPPTYTQRAWVWTDVNHSGPARLPSTAQFTSCQFAPAPSTHASIALSLACVLSAPTGTETP